MHRTIFSFLSFTTIVMFLSSCVTDHKTSSEHKTNTKGKIVVYQVFTRLFGNTNANNKPWGTIDENGVGKFADFTHTALDSIKALGISHIWYTGVPHHALVTDYSAFGIPGDDPDVVKGRAGSPYAVKDYYNVNPDLALDPANRLEEFKSLVQRTHQHGLKVIIDIVPNHVARRYHGLSNPEGIADLGATDDLSKEYARDNNFYYIPNQPFKVSEPLDGYRPLGGEAHPLTDGNFDENPAKWTGNGSRLAQPNFYDWYETVKVNYGIRPDGSKDFPLLPQGFEKKTVAEHFAFWQTQSVPNSWIKFRDIALYWLKLGVDGFRFDMAEMVPVEFWSFMNSSIKQTNPDAFLLAEVYNPALYRDYLQVGKMDYLYDKVQLYDSLKSIMQGRGSTDHLNAIQTDLHDIEGSMLHFLENHDEQRIASPEFAGDANKGKPAMVVSATMSSAPLMVYFGQEVGEPAAADAGFGTHSRTSIFDYVGVPHHQRWMNGGAFDGALLTSEEKTLRDFYKRLLNFTLNCNALKGNYIDLHSYNRTMTANYTNRLFSFARSSADEKLVVIVNFDEQKSVDFDFQIPADVIKLWNLSDGRCILTDQLYGHRNMLTINNGVGVIPVVIKPLESFIYCLE